MSNREASIGIMGATGLVGTRSPYGACENSFNPKYVSGGSSSGSAVAVAAGLVSFSLGTYRSLGSFEGLHKINVRYFLHREMCCRSQCLPGKVGQ